MVPCPSPWFPAHLGHECLVVKAWCPGFDLPAPPYEPVLDGVNDRHSAQHNVNVQLLPPGSQFQLAIEVANISRFAQAMVVQVRTLDFRRLSGTLAMLGVPLRHGLIETGRGMPLRARLSEESSFLRESSPGRRRGRPAQRATASRPSAGLVAELSAQFAPSEHRQLLLSGTVPREARRARRSASR